MEKLKPCPFCGSDNVHLSHWTDQAYVYCANCMIKTDVYLHSGCDKKAVEAWNRRADEDKVFIPEGYTPAKIGDKNHE